MVHWFKENIAKEDDPLAWLVESPEQAESNAQESAARLLRSIREGRRPGLAENRFYALTLSGAGGRVMVRDWMEGRFDELVKNVKAWFDDLSITHRNGGGALAKPPKFMAVLGSTVRDLKDLPGPFVSNMWHVAVAGEMIPYAALAQALARVKVAVIEDQPANHARMGLLKAYHIRKARIKGGDMSSQIEPYLNEGHPSYAHYRRAKPLRPRLLPADG